MTNVWVAYGATTLTCPNLAKGATAQCSGSIPYAVTSADWTSGTATVAATASGSYGSASATATNSISFSKVALALVLASPNTTFTAAGQAFPVTATVTNTGARRRPGLGGSTRARVRA